MNMKIKLFRAEVQILPEGGLKAWFEKRVVVTGKGETKEDKPWMPDVNKVFEQHKIWNDGRMYSLAPLLVHPIINSEPHWSMPLVGLLFFILAMYLAYREVKQQGKRKPNQIISPSENLRRTLARMEAEEAAKRIPKPSKKTTWDSEGRVIDWADPNKLDRIPIEDLINENSINYYKNFSYNFLEQQQKLWNENKNAQKLFLNFFKVWSRHKGWGTKDNHPHREEIKKLVAFDLPDWKEKVSITTPL